MCDLILLEITAVQINGKIDWDRSLFLETYLSEIEGIYRYNLYAKHLDVPI